MNSIIFSCINSFFFFFIKYIDYKFVKKEKISVKLLFRDTVCVFISSYITIFLADKCRELNLFDEYKSITPVFTGNAEF